MDRSLLRGIKVMLFVYLFAHVYTFFCNNATKSFDVFKMFYRNVLYPNSYPPPNQLNKIFSSRISREMYPFPKSVNSGKK